MNIYEKPIKKAGRCHAVVDLNGHYGKDVVLLLWVTVDFFNQNDKYCSSIVAQFVNSGA